jgi:hypothetical protein
MTAPVWSNLRTLSFLHLFLSTMVDAEDVMTMNMLSNYVDEYQDSDTKTNKNKWEGVGEKERERKKHSIFEPTSYKYLPAALMSGKAPGSGIVHTTKLLAINIKIRPPEDAKQSIHKTRVVAAVMKAFQSMYPDTYLATIHNNHDPKYLINEPTDIPIDDHLLDDYLISAGDGRQFIGKIYIHTNTDTLYYKRSPQLRCYLAKENIVLDENKLMSVRPPNVGFLETIIPRNETIDLHTKRLQQKLPANIPPFQLCISSLYVRSGQRCRVLMMKAEQQHVAEIQEAMSNLAGVNKTPFFPWGEYLSLTINQREDIINHQNRWNKAVKSLLLSGFTNGSDKLKMKTEEEGIMDSTGPRDYLLDTTITEYFKKHVQAGNGSNLFAYVYPPTLGTYEFLVKAQHESEAKDYLKRAIGELTKRMTEDVIELAFTDVETAKQSIYLPNWRPYSRALMLLPEQMPTGDSINQNYYKRSRGEESYLPKPVEKFSNPANQEPYAARTTVNRTDSITTSTGDSTIGELTKKVEDLQNNIDKRIQDHININNIETKKLIEEKNSQLNIDLTAKIEKGNIPINKCLDKLTDMMASMQETTTRNNVNIEIIMSRLGVNRSDMRDESISLLFDDETRDASGILDTPVKPAAHGYNTRSSAKMEIDQNNLNGSFNSPNNLGNIVSAAAAASTVSK